MALTITQPQFYPGMLTADTEFFTVEGEVNFISNRQIKDISEMPYGIAKLIEEKIASEKETEAALEEMHPSSKFKQKVQFIKCRYGGLDYSADIKNNTLQDGDYWECPKRSTCKHNGVICKAPKYQGKLLNAIDVRLMQLLSTNETNEAVASILSTSFGSLHKIKKELYTKLGVQTKQEVAIIAKNLNII